MKADQYIQIQRGKNITSTADYEQNEKNREHKLLYWTKQLLKLRNAVQDSPKPIGDTLAEDEYE